MNANEKYIKTNAVVTYLENWVKDEMNKVYMRGDMEKPMLVKLIEDKITIITEKGINHW